MLEARAAVRKLQAYHPPLAGRQGLRLDFNENTVGCSPRVLACIRSLDAETLARYPDREPVEREVARFMGLDSAQLLLTNGVDEAIHLLCSTYLEAGDEAIIVTPTFAMYSLFAQAEEAQIVEVHSGPDFSFPMGALQAKITPRTRLIAVANPNNPTGAAVSETLILQIAEAAPQAALLVDEAYFEFHGETLLANSERPDNLFVARTFSKAYGLAGLRIGVLVGETEQMAMVRRVASPYNVNAVALAVLPEALRDTDFVERYAAEVRSNRTVLEGELRAMGLRYWPSRGNFVLTRIGPLHKEFVRSLRDRGILVRDRNSDPGCGGCVRLTVGSDEHTRILIAAMRGVADDLALTREVRA
ncbi:MAG TPA: histidinol-phosphate transaminase [Candidatus Sulfotelmatobacter sp.]|nr:histidinol-phosphate transaminase [Candidatus Sulfotelmatobacter sp.]